MAPANDLEGRQHEPTPRAFATRCAPPEAGRLRLARLLGRLIARQWLHARRRPESEDRRPRA